MNGTTYRVIIAQADASSPYTLTVNNGSTDENLTTFVKTQQALFEGRMDTVSTWNSNVAAAHPTEWAALVSALSPTKLFDETKDAADAASLTTAYTTLTFRDDSDTGYYEVISDIVNAFVDLQQALLADGWTADQFQGLLKGVNSVINLNVCNNFAPLAAAARDRKSVV